jgi:hypothetical protein
VREASAVEAAADGLDHAVHHAGWGDHVGSGSGMAHGLLDKQGERGVVVDVEAAAGLHKRPAVAVVGVLAEAQVGDDQQVRRLALRQANGLLDDAVVVGGC